ncbi:phosphatidylcholine transfer protein-like isoform X2 [Juglans microcarpa x Juglans regia]|uniref:phosphatidylcholine transfer protein-like isoform X2 n=1 Tax=Juglans microcarpa x Juglans regia TaxID=2249226 RepID=UPI001B7F1224|nr:phosphatidylcholine transfer protein-like isoform X2 [Juglans microcarpa x Juglans regia]
MFKVWDSRNYYFHSMSFGGSLNELWRENGHGGWATVFALIVILVWHCYKRFPFIFSSSNLTPSDSGARIHPQLKMSEIVSDADLKFLIENLDEKHHDNEKWEHVIDKRNTVLFYNAKCCKPKDGPLKYLSETVFENCSPEMLRDFYMDNDYRKKWDKTLVEHEQLQVDQTNGVEIGRTIKKFPLLTPREYILAWRLWEGKDRTFYCFIKECEHSSTPRQKKYVRVRYFRSGWRIREVPGRNACEIKMFHQEDAGLNVKMAKLAFAKGIWSYVCNMDNALLKYSAVSHPHSAVTAVTLIQKVPPALDTMEGSTSSATAFLRQITNEPKEKKFIRRPSRKFLANGLLFVGGAICLSRGHNSLGAKVAMAYILAKLSKRGTASDQSRES